MQGLAVDLGIMPKDNSKALFLSEQWKRLGKQSVQKMVKVYAAKAGIRAYPHKLRHTALTQIYRRTRDIYFTSKIAGHSNLTTTQLYAHMDTEYLKEVYQKASIDYGAGHPCQNQSITTRNQSAKRKLRATNEVYETSRSVVNLPKDRAASLN